MPACSYGIFLMISDYLWFFSVVEWWWYPANTFDILDSWHLGSLGRWLLCCESTLGECSRCSTFFWVYIFLNGNHKRPLKTKTHTKPEPKSKRTRNSKLFQNVMFHVPPPFFCWLWFFSKRNSTHHLHQKAMRLKVRSRLARCAALGGIKSCATGASLQAPSCLKGLCCWLKPSEVVEHPLNFFHWHSTYEGSMGRLYTYPKKSIKCR